MTICFFSAQYLPTVGGVERYTYNLAKRVIRRGHRAVVVTSALAGLPARETDPDGIEILRLPAFGLMGGRFPVVRPCAEFRRLSKTLWQEIRPDFVVANNLFYTLSLYAAFAAKKRKVPALLINHGTQYLMTGNPVLVWMGKVYEHMLAQLIRRRIDRFCAVSGAGADWLWQAFGIKADGIVYNAVDPAELEQLAAGGEKDWRGRSGLEKNTPLIGFSGRVIPEKGADKLCDAMAEIRKAVPDAAAILAGDGNLLEALRARCPQGVFLAGKVSYEDSLALIAQSDLFCLPTRSEGFASTVLEAAALKTPILTTPTGGSVELLPDGEYGTLMPDMSVQAIVEACVRGLRDTQWRRRAAANARARLCEHFTWDKSTDTLLEMIGRACCKEEK